MLSICDKLPVESLHIKARGGGVLSPKSYVDVPAGPRKSDYLYTNFLPNFPPISIPFSKEKHPILIKLGAFYNNLPKMHPIYVIWAPSSLMKTPHRYTNFHKKVPQKAGTYTYTMSMWEPPPPPGIKVCKIILGVHKKSTDNAVRGELGSHPLLWVFMLSLAIGGNLTINAIKMIKLLQFRHYLTTEN